MVTGPDAVAEDAVAVAGSDCADSAAPEDNVLDDETVSGVVAVPDEDDIVGVVDWVVVHEVVLQALEVVRLITCR